MKTLKKNVVNTSLNIFGKTSGIHHPKYTKPWWNEQCEEVVLTRKLAKKELKRNPTPMNLIYFKKCEAIFKGLSR